ncbi:hypothetical protein F5Y17DRAFT_420083 [Xylariaceae sp. FL0594]|nr:hypothetical protein F5Y17DRAFT_420083 [Xylariaceae sp. FL0594]
MEGAVDSKAQAGYPSSSGASMYDETSAVKPEPVDAPIFSTPQALSSLLALRTSQPADTRSPTVKEEASDIPVYSPKKVKEGPNYLQTLCTQTTAEVLEVAVPVAKQFLSQLRTVLSDCPKDAAVESWIKAIDDLEENSQRPRTVIGVVGITGAGKNSLINALLDEERLLPTNCLRACTASPIEISFNHSDDPEELYRAEIEFISAEAWTRDLQYMFSDLLDASGKISREASSLEGDAGVAYQKIKAVYPQKTKDMLARASPEELAQEPAVRRVLGTRKLLKAGTAKNLYSRLQQYVDSKEKLSAGGIRKDATMEYWPLMKVIRIFTKADALSTGAVVVDLPGTQDSNAARAAEAQGYMKSCTGIWVVAEITRAVDNKTAKTLLDDSFKRQLKYDATYEVVSFICSKIDDISIEEAAGSLGLEEELYESWNEAEDSKRDLGRLGSQITDKRRNKAALDEQLDECEVKSEEWEELMEKLMARREVYAPPSSSSGSGSGSGSKKRKQGAVALRSRKNMAHEVDDDDSEVMDDSELNPSDTEDPQSEPRKPLTMEDIEDQLSSIRALQKQLRSNVRLLSSEIVACRNQYREVQAKRDRILAKLKAVCIRGRNQYSTAAIKQDLAAGIRELDQEHAAEENDETFDPDADIRDYDEVARRLPVFCVSSRAYQKLRGRLEKDDYQTDGFLSIEDTGVPDLQAHTKKLTESQRANHFGQFLNRLSELVNSVKLWSTSAGTRSSLTDNEILKEAQQIDETLNALRKTLDALLESSMTQIQGFLMKNVSKVVDSSLPRAIEAAPGTAESWGAHRNQGGLLWATYKATVRRNGAFSGASGPRDFNQELFDPISRKLANGWESAFQRNLPAVLTAFGRASAAELKRFHETVGDLARKHKVDALSISTLSSQVQVHGRSLEALMVGIVAKLTELQRDANRLFVPAIGHSMAPAYQICADERGQGSYARMKAHMAAHVQIARQSMFHDARDVVREQLENMCGYIKMEIASRIEPILVTMHRDYMRTLVGIEAGASGQAVPRSLEGLDVLQRVQKALDEGDRLFAPLVDRLLSPVSEEPETQLGIDGTTPDRIRDGNAVASEGPEQNETPLDKSTADDFIQADIRGQGYMSDSEESGTADNMGTVKEEFADEWSI